MKWMQMTEEFVGCWWRCVVKAPKLHPVGAGVGGGGSDGREGIQTQSPTPGDSGQSEPPSDWHSC